MDWVAAVTGVLGGGALGGAVSWRQLSLERQKWVAEQQSHVRQREIQRYEEAASVLDVCYAFVHTPKNLITDERTDRWRAEFAQMAFRVDQQYYLMKAYGTKDASETYDLVHDELLSWGDRENNRAPDDEPAEAGPLLRAISDARRANAAALKSA